MPTETGLVVETKGSKAIVKTVRGEACHSCSSKGFCDTVGGGAEMRVEVRNEIGARAGDTVLIEISDETFLAMSTLVYLVPVLGLLGGMAAGKALAAPRAWDENLVSLLFGFAVFALTMAVVRWIGMRKAEKDPRMVPRIVSIQKKTL